MTQINWNGALTLYEDSGITRTTRKVTVIAQLADGGAVVNVEPNESLIVEFAPDGTFRKSSTGGGSALCIRNYAPESNFVLNVNAGELVTLLALLGKCSGYSTYNLYSEIKDILDTELSKATWDWNPMEINCPPSDVLKLIDATDARGSRVVNSPRGGN